MIKLCLGNGNHSLARRLGFLLDLLNRRQPGLKKDRKIQVCLFVKHPSKKKHGISKKWRLILNIEENRVV